MMIRNRENGATPPGKKTDYAKGDQLKGDDGAIYEFGGYDDNGRPVLNLVSAPEAPAEPTSEKLVALKQELARVYDAVEENKRGAERTREAKREIEGEIAQLQEKLKGILELVELFQVEGQENEDKWVKIQQMIATEKTRLKWTIPDSAVDLMNDTDDVVYQQMFDAGSGRSGDKKSHRGRRVALAAVATLAVTGGGWWAYAQNNQNNEPQAIGACDISDGSATSFTSAKFSGSVPLTFWQPSTDEPFPFSEDGDNEIPVELTAGEISVVHGLCLENVEEAVVRDGAQVTVNLEHATRTAAVSPAQLELNPFDQIKNFDLTMIELPTPEDPTPEDKDALQRDKDALARYFAEGTREAINRRAAEVMAEKALTDPALQGERAEAQEAKLEVAVKEWAEKEGIENVTVAFSGEVSDFSILNAAEVSSVTDGITLVEDKVKVASIN